MECALSIQRMASDRVAMFSFWCLPNRAPFSKTRLSRLIALLVLVLFSAARTCIHYSGAVCYQPGNLYQITNTLGHVATVVDGLNSAIFNARPSGNYDSLNRLVQTIDAYNGTN
jgi:hypothetical protein